MSEEKIDPIDLASLITILKDTLEEFKKSQRENSNLQREIMNLIKENMSLKMETEPVGDGEPQPKLPQPKPNIEFQNPDQTMDENNRSMFNPMRSSRRMKPRRPTINDQLDGIGWDIFLDAWTRYKRLAELNDGEES